MNIKRKYQTIPPHQTTPNEESTLDDALERIPFGKFHLMYFIPQYFPHLFQIIAHLRACFYV